MLLLMPAAVWAFQPARTVRGTVRDAATLQPLPWVQVTLESSDYSAATETDTLGRFRLEAVPPGRYVLQAHLLGYATLTMPEVLAGGGKEVVLDLQLEAAPDTLGEVVVRVPATPRSMTILPVVTIERTFRFPATFYDPARLAVAYPAMMTWNDQGNLLIARGNSPNQNTWQLEGVPIVNPNHTPNAGTATDQVTLSGGGVNMLSAQMLGNTTFYLGAAPASVGDATGALLDMRLRRGNDRQTEGTFQLSLIGIDLAGEGPFGKKDRAARPSWLANYRYSTVGLLTALGMDFGGEAIGFQDLSAAMDWPTARGHVKVFALAGASHNTFRGQPADSLRMEAKDRLDIDFRSRMGAFGISHYTTLRNGWLWKSTLVRSALRSDWEAAFVEDATSFGRERLSQSWTAFRSALSGAAARRIRWSAGLAGRYLDESDDFRFAERQQQGQGHMRGLWLKPWFELERALERWRLRMGLRGHYFTWNGSRALDPRLEVRFRLSANAALYSSWGLYSQLHTVRVYAAATDGEGRLLNKDLPMLRSQQATLGWERTFAREGYVKAEAFWQYFFDVPVGAEAPWFSVLNMINEPATTALTPAGSGTRYGLELTLDRPLWHSFFVHGGATLFRSLWTDAAGRTWPSRFDRGWGSTLTVGRERVHHKQRRTLINQIALTSLAGGGMRETPIDLAASINTGTTQWDASRPFADRLPPYFRMDLRWSRRWEKDGRSSLLALDIQNLTNRRNVAWRYYDAVQQKVVTRYQLGLIPVLTWRLEF